MSERFSGMCMREKVKGTCDYQKTDFTVGRGIGTKYKITKCKTACI